MKTDDQTKSIENDNNESSRGLQATAIIIYLIVFIATLVITGMITKDQAGEIQKNMGSISGTIQAAQPAIEALTGNQPVASIIGPLTDNVTSSVSDLMNMITRNAAISGALAQIQVLFSAFITLVVHKKGYFLALALNTISFALAFGKVIQLHAIQAIPGCIIPLSTIILVTIIYAFSNKVVQKNKEISKNYAQILETNKMIKEQDEKLSYLAYYDVLTDLPNRQLFIDKLDETILNSSNMPFTVLLSDIDNFKQVNDAYGNNSGDILLNTYAEKLKSFCGDSIFLARIGGDEFGFIIQGSMTEANILNYVEKIQNIISEPVQINDTFIRSTISLGIASYPNNAVTSSDILKCLDNAIFFAKSNGKNRPCFYGQQ